ncbi:hypothetical protein AJ79_09534 [Helicocarpus griseus UAMH5409]|uniref:Uncharacterized protein n=1 Tax=Helicocarpus griseus UAMH5409 TaxID=1447875 RepID=A0A2B7WIV3_9EURO|nr:hypothetical protein AJ79_09534 [Helicocarpus griseus UAMH5409]
MDTRQFKSRLETAIKDSYPENKTSNYDSVTVHLLLWDNDHLDLKRGEEVERLRDVFATHYGYSAKMSYIPITAHDNWLFDAFLEYGNDKTARDLVIVYYAGAISTWLTLRVGVGPGLNITPILLNRIPIHADRSLMVHRDNKSLCRGKDS